MSWEGRGKLCLALFLGSNCLAGHAGAGRPANKAPLTVRFYNYAAVPEQTLGPAQRVADAVFRAAGITVVWVECPVSEADAERGLSCPQLHDPPYVVLNFVPVSRAAQYHHPAGELGLATYPDAYVFLDRLREYCNQVLAPEATVLGQVMAHEVGHLILGEKSHSPAGIMRAVLKPCEMTGDKRCNFTNSQGDQMRAWIHKRIRFGQPGAAADASGLTGSRKSP